MTCLTQSTKPAIASTDCHISHDALSPSLHALAPATVLVAYESVMSLSHGVHWELITRLWVLWYLQHDDCTMLIRASGDGVGMKDRDLHFVGIQ